MERAHIKYYQKIIKKLINKMLSNITIRLYYIGAHF